ncbi:hypothetical protein Tco_0639870 [Tanacetum coccineum]
MKMYPHQIGSMIGLWYYSATVRIVSSRIPELPPLLHRIGTTVPTMGRSRTLCMQRVIQERERADDVRSGFNDVAIKARIPERTYI